MYGTSCDRHTGSLDEPRNRWPSGLQQIQVLPRSFGHGTGRWGVSGTWSPVVFILGPCHDWSDLATDTTGLGKKCVFFVQWAGNAWRCMNQWRCEQLTLEDLQGVDGWGAGELCHYFEYMSYVHFWTHLNCWKNVIPTTMDSSGFVLPSGNISIHRSQIPQRIGVPEAISIRKLGHFWRDLCLKLLWKVGDPGWLLGMGCFTFT